MGDIDLVPASYRDGLRVKRWLRGFGAALALLLVASIGGRVLLSWSLRTEAGEIRRLQGDRKEVLSTRSRIETLDARQAELEKRMRVLEGLRGGPTVREVFLAIDRALDGKVWFVDWKFMRAGEYVPAPVPARQQAGAAGYFVVVPATGGENGQKAWKMATHMEIRGQAVDHTALAGFVGRLSRQSPIEDVKLLSTRVRDYTSGPVVDFELAVLVHGAAKSS